MVSHVATPATISVRTVDPRSEIRKNRSSPEVEAGGDCEGACVATSVSFRTSGTGGVRSCSGKAVRKHRTALGTAQRGAYSAAAGETSASTEVRRVNDDYVV